MNALEYDTFSAARLGGLIMVGEWGDGKRVWGVFCRPEDRQRVRAAYNAPEEGDPTALAQIQAAGGILVPDVED